MANADEIKKIITDIRARRKQWILSSRQKNLATLAELAISSSVAFEFIYNHLQWQDYVSGPEPDNHQIPGDIWVFGLTIEHKSCYLKFQDRPSGMVVWISLHEAVRPLRFPFK